MVCPTRRCTGAADARLSNLAIVACAGPVISDVSQGIMMLLRAISVFILTATAISAADVTYPEWATTQITDYMAGKLSAPADKRFFWYGDDGKTWTAGVAFVHSKTFGEGLLVVPDLGKNVAYLAFKTGSTFSTKGEAHDLGFGFCPYLTTKTADLTIEIEPDASAWVPSK